MPRYSKRPSLKQSTEERTKAKELAERTGVPLWGAYRIIRGETTLNDLLKSMMRREKFQRLRGQGMDSDLAGHVSAGTLPAWRAKVLQEMRHAGRGKFTRDRIEMAHREELPLGLWRFGQDWAAGRVVHTRTYDFNFQVDGVDEPVTVFKHDVKMLCHPADLEAVVAARRFDKKVLKMGLGASRERKDRYRPTDEQLCAVRDAGKAAKWVFRDGTAVHGKIVAFGRWDADLVLEGDANASLFFHALHEATDRGLR